MASNPQQEPTMEEILASIRKIISEDSPDPSADTKAAPVVHAQADVLELTQEISDEPVTMAAPPMPEPEIVSHPVEEAAVSNEAHSDVTVHEGIFSDKTRKALEDSFARIEPSPSREKDAAVAPAAAVPLTSIDGRTVEAVFEHAVRETFDPVMNEWLGANKEAIIEHMKPLIREWMDEHFPALLEGAVRDEVARVARSRR